jgi:hypothetical protein
MVPIVNPFVRDCHGTESQGRGVIDTAAEKVEEVADTAKDALPRK